MARVLIIEDDPQASRFFKVGMEQAGFEARVASNGLEGFDLLGGDAFDVVITDIVMPEMEGIEVIRRLVREYPDVKIVAVSGGGKVGPDSYLAMAKALGAHRAFKKPVDTKVLQRAVSELVEVEDN